MSKPFADGAYVYQRLNLVTDGKASSHTERARLVTLHLHIGAPEFYPNHSAVVTFAKH